MKKRALSLIFASITAAACIVSGCGGGSGSSIIIPGGEQTQTASLTVYGHRGDRYSLSIIEDTLQSYMRENSQINVSYESAKETDYWQSLDRRWASGKLDDVFMIDRARLIEMSAEGALADLSDAVDKSIFNSFARSQIGDGAIYAVPTCITTYGLYANFTLLQKHGINEVPSNLNQFTTVCNYFKDQGVTPIICNNYSSLRSLILARGMYGVYGTENTESQISKFNADPSALAKQLESGIDLVYEMIESGWIDIKAASSTTHLSGDLNQFADGEAPFMITGGWASTTLKEMISAKGKSFRYSIHAFPVLYSPEDERPACVLVEQTDFISVKKGANEGLAKELISMLAGTEALLKLNAGQSCFSPLNMPMNEKNQPDSAIMSSAKYHLQEGKYVIGSDMNLKFDLDGILTECGVKILNGESAENVKAYLLLELLKSEAGR